MNVALDLEEVLADTIAVSCNSTEKIERSDFSTWDLDDYTWQVYNGISDALWRHDPLSIPPVEDGLAETVNELDDRVDQLDIVTARLHVDEHINKWLAHHGIKANALITTRTEKWELGYDLYIDDNPKMVGECRLLLRNQCHNNHVDATSAKSADRIHSIDEVLQFVQ